MATLPISSRAGNRRDKLQSAAMLASHGEKRKTDTDQQQVHAD